MAVPTTLESLSPTAQADPAAGDNVSAGDDNLRSAFQLLRQTVTAGSDIASASTITPASTGSSFNLTGTTTVTAIGSTNSWDGRIIWFRHTGAHAFTHSSTLVCLGGASITFASGDISAWRQRTSGTWDQVVMFRTGTIPFGTNLFATSDGRVYGTALHNNAGAVTGTTNQYIASGTYTPTLTGVTNITGTTSSGGQWIRVGNIVHVVARMSIDPTAAGTFTELRISLPIASNFSSTTQGGGVGCSQESGSPYKGGVIKAETVNDDVVLSFASDAGAANEEWRVTFSYEIL